MLQKKHDIAQSEFDKCHDMHYGCMSDDGNDQGISDDDDLPLFGDE